MPGDPFFGDANDFGAINHNDGIDAAGWGAWPSTTTENNNNNNRSNNNSRGATTTARDPPQDSAWDTSNLQGWGSVTTNNNNSNNNTSLIMDDDDDSAWRNPVSLSQSTTTNRTESPFSSSMISSQNQNQNPRPSPPANNKTSSAFSSNSNNKAKSKAAGMVVETTNLMPSVPSSSMASPGVELTPTDNHNDMNSSTPGTGKSSKGGFMGRFFGGRKNKNKKEKDTANSTSNNNKRGGGVGRRGKQNNNANANATTTPTRGKGLTVVTTPSPIRAGKSPNNDFGSAFSPTTAPSPTSAVAGRSSNADSNPNSNANNNNFASPAKQSSRMTMAPMAPSNQTPTTPTALPPPPEAAPNANSSRRPRKSTTPNRLSKKNGNMLQMVGTNDDDAILQQQQEQQDTNDSSSLVRAADEPEFSTQDTTPAPTTTTVVEEIPSMSSIDEEGPTTARPAAATTTLPSLLAAPPPPPPPPPPRAKQSRASRLQQQGNNFKPTPTETNNNYNVANVNENNVIAEETVSQQKQEPPPPPQEYAMTAPGAPVRFPLSPPKNGTMVLGGGPTPYQYPPPSLSPTRARAGLLQPQPASPPGAASKAIAHRINSSDDEMSRTSSAHSSTASPTRQQNSASSSSPSLRFGGLHHPNKQGSESLMARYRSPASPPPNSTGHFQNGDATDPDLDHVGMMDEEDDMSDTTDEDHNDAGDNEKPMASIQHEKPQQHSRTSSGGSGARGEEKKMDADDISDISFNNKAGFSPSNNGSKEKKIVVAGRGRHRNAVQNNNPAGVRRRSPSPAMARQRQESAAPGGAPPELPQMLHPETRHEQSQQQRQKPPSIEVDEVSTSSRPQTSPSMTSSTRKMSQRLAERRQRKIQTKSSGDDGGSVVTESSSMDESKITTKASGESLVTLGRRRFGDTAAKSTSPARKLNRLKKNQFHQQSQPKQVQQQTQPKQHVQQQPPPPTREPVKEITDVGKEKIEERDASRSPTPYRSVVQRAANRVSTTPPQQKQLVGLEGAQPVPSAGAALKNKHAATKERMRRINNASPMPSNNNTPNARAAALRRRRFQSSAPPPPAPPPKESSNNKTPITDNRQRPPVNAPIRAASMRSLDSASSTDITDMSNNKRSFLYRSRHTPSPTPTRATAVIRPTLSESSGSSVFSSFDEQNVTDPMQRAGLRLLSAAVIPIQAAARRHLALRAALMRMWAIVLIQTTVRRWAAVSFLRKSKKAATDIQRITRGVKVRDEILLEHCCAIEIQRRVRGFLATLRVYEAIYKITVVQTVVRRQQAIALATDKMIWILQMQSLARGFLTRRRMFWLHYAASIIQATWRGAHNRLNYQLDLLDIVIAQSAVRRKLARIEADRRRDVRDDICATLIQAQWRGTYARMSFTLYILVVIEIQNFFRRVKAKKVYNKLKFEHDSACATKVQSAFRGYSARLNYHIHLIAIIDIQSCTRRLLAKREVSVMRHEKHTDCAIIVQSAFRGFAARTSYQLHLMVIIDIQCFLRRIMAQRDANKLRAERDQRQVELEKYSATRIQSAWRGFDDFSRFVLFLNSVIVLQSNWRRITLRKEYLIARDERRERSATLIQTQWRGFADSARYQTDLCSIILVQSVYRRKAACDFVEAYRDSRRFVASTIVQAWGRRLLAQKQLEKHKAARTIQSQWRSYDATMNFLHYLADVIMVQGIARRWLQRHRASRKIQSVARMHAVQKHNKEVAAATAIQRQWRGFVCYADYMFTMADIIVTQSVARRFIEKKRYTVIRDAHRNEAARTIQKAVGYRRMVKDEAAAEIQRTWRGFVAETEYFINIVERRAAIKIQALWRRFYGYSTYVIKLDSTIRIQSAARSFLAFRKFEETIGAAIIIQNVIRIFLAQVDATNVSALRFVAQAADISSARENKSALNIQTAWRCSFIRRAYVSYIAARKIQTTWRYKSLRTPYLNFVSARRLQCFWRSVLAIRTFVKEASARLIQTNWRRFYVRRAYVGFSAARMIQTNWRRFNVHRAYTTYRAASKIQALWRGCSIKKAYDGYTAARDIQSCYRRYTVQRAYLCYRASRRIQATVRRFLAERMLVKNLAARKLQAIWRMHVTREYYSMTSGSICIQKYWRRYEASRNLKMTLASRRIQSCWRRYWLQSAFIFYKASRAIQTRWRTYACRTRYEGMLQQIREYCAATSIQSAWRMKSGRMHFIALREYMLSDKIEAAITVQKVWRGLQVRDQGYRFVQWIFIRDVRDLAATIIQRHTRGIIAREHYAEYVSATRIQKMWRGYRAMENYWHVLGSAIQIQAVARGWLQCTRYNKQVMLTPTIQRAVRCYFAREELARRKFILKLVNQVNKKSPKSQEPRKPAKQLEDPKVEWTTVVADRQRIDRAARTLQKFFRMVKKEVDRAIRAEKKKRRYKNKEKRRRHKGQDHEDDDLLENVWNTTVQNKHESKSRSSQRKGRTSRHGSRTKSRKDDTVVLSSRRQFENEDDGTSVVSFFSNTNSQARVPKSRMGLSEKEKDDDLALETAWMDTEVAYKKKGPSKKKWNGVSPINTKMASSQPHVPRRSHQRMQQQHYSASANVGRRDDSRSSSRGRSLSVERRAPQDDAFIAGKMGASSNRLPPGGGGGRSSHHIPEHLLRDQRDRSRSHSSDPRTYRV